MHKQFSMKKLRTIFTAAAMLLAFLSHAQQREMPPPAERANRTVERLKPELSLTDAQVKEVTPIYTSFFEGVDALRSGGERPSPEARQKLTEERDAKLKKVLDEAQMKKLKEVEEQMRQRRPNG